MSQEPYPTAHGGMFCLGWKRGKLRGEEPESFGDLEATSGLYFSKNAEGSVLEATGMGIPGCISDGDGSSWSLQGVWEEEAQAVAGGQATSPARTRLRRKLPLMMLGTLQSWHSRGLACRRCCFWSGHGLANFKGVLGRGFIFAKR